MPRDRLTKPTDADADLDVDVEVERIREQGRAAARRTALVTQADISRAIRATQAAGLTIARIVVRPDGVAIETVDAPHSEPIQHDPARKRIKL